MADGTNPTDAASAKYTLTVSARNGVAVANPVETKYHKGTAVTLANTPNAGHAFVGWSGGPFRGDNFALKATGTITLPTGGTWTFGTNSDDGARVDVNGITVIYDHGPHAPQDAFGQVTLPAGQYEIQVTCYEYWGGEVFELFAAPGFHNAFNENFRLVGDTANGGLSVTTLEGGLSVPGFTVRQVESLTTPIYNLGYAEDLLSGSYAKRQEVTAICEILNFHRYPLHPDHFGNNEHFPLSLTIGDNPVVITMEGNYSITALNSIPLGTALDSTNLVWLTGESTPWLGEMDATAYDTVDAAASGPVDDGQKSALQATVEGPGVLTFWWKVSSQASSDYLNFQVDGSTQSSISGEMIWQQVSYNVPAGKHAVGWIYQKDSGGSGGSDRGWVDQVVWTPTRYTLNITASGGAVTRSPDKAEYLPGEVVTLSATSDAGRVFGGWSGDLSGMTNPAAITMSANRSVTANFVDVGALPAAVEATAFPWNTGGDGLWRSQTETTHDGADAVRSGIISSGQSSWIETTVTLYQPDTLRFWWKVSSQQYADHLSVSVNGGTYFLISGEVDWERQSLSLGAGTHTIRWTYSKRYSGSNGQDAAWLDEVRFDTHTTPFAGWIASHGFTGNAANPLSNPDSDRANNLLEFAFNLNPATNDSRTLTPGSGTSGLPSVRTIGTGSNSRLVVEYVRRRNAGLDYTVRFANAPGQSNWVPAINPPVVTPIDLEWERVVVEDSETAATSPRRFGTVVVSQR